MEQVNVKRNIVEYDVLRFVLTILVIIGHCSYYQIKTEFGGIDYTVYADNNLILYNVFGKIVKLIYLFHMPCYIALSGALFHYSCTHKRKSIDDIMLSRFKRLLIPFLLVTFFYSVPIKYISGYWANSSNTVKDILVGQVLLQGNSHLWFLPTLFFVLIITYVLLYNFKLNIYVYLFVAFAMHIVSYIIPIHFLKYIFQYMLWFGIGYWFDIKRTAVNKSTSKKTILLDLLFFILSASVIVVNDSNILHINLIMKIIAAITGSYMLYCFSYYLSTGKIVQNRIYRVILDNSLGLYLYSDPINYFILYASLILFGSVVFKTESSTAILFFSRFIITTAIALFVCRLLKKFKFKYVC